MVHAPHDPSAGRRRGAGEGRRKLDQGHSRRAGGAGTRASSRVVADKEWDAIRAAAAAQGRMVGRRSRRSPTRTTLYDHIRKAPVRKREVDGKPVGNVDDAFKTAARVIEAEYEWPFQSHASMGPACAAGRDQGRQRHLLDRLAEAALRARTASPRTLGMPADKVRAIWVVGPGSYGRNDADDAAMDAAVLSKAIGKPVRVQYMRDQGTGWDPKGPASIHRARAAIDAAGNVIAYEFISKGFSRVDVNTNGSQPQRHAGRPLPRRRAEVRRRLRRAGRILRVRQQAHVVGDDPAAARPRLAAAHLASARSGRAADPLRQRIVHGRDGGARSASIRSSSGCATSRTRATSR